MSYGIDFVRREPQDDDDLDDPELHRPLRSSPRLRERVLAALTEPKEFTLPNDGHVITDMATGVQVWHSDDGVGITVTYGDSVDGGTRVDTMYRLAAILEEETGLLGYDPQTGQLLSATEPEQSYQAYQYGIAATEQVIANLVDRMPKPVEPRPEPKKARRFRFPRLRG